jgi:hypothetical protein
MISKYITPPLPNQKKRKRKMRFSEIKINSPIVSARALSILKSM